MIGIQDVGGLSLAAGIAESGDRSALAQSAASSR
jgi:hypothetical protein